MDVPPLEVDDDWVFQQPPRHGSVGWLLLLRQFHKAVSMFVNTCICVGNYVRYEFVNTVKQYRARLLHRRNRSVHLS